MSFQSALYRVILGSIVCILVGGCDVPTSLDMYRYPSKTYFAQLQDNPDMQLLCTNLERQGYAFERFQINEFGIEISYPNGAMRRFPQSRSLSIILLADIARDWDIPTELAAGELNRLQGVAQAFCFDYYSISGDLGIDRALHGVMLWDWISGARVQFGLSAICDVSNGSVSMGSYGNRYDEDNDGICPSGHVQF